MDSKNIIISLIYYVGIASCAAQGAEKGKNEKYIPMLHYIANAFGGGFIRDVILNVHPWLFTESALPDLSIVIISGFLYTYCFFIVKAKKNYSKMIRLITITDAFGLGSFVCIGMDRAIECSNNIFIIIACGYITAIGGGILASGKKFTKIYKNKDMIHYHFIVLLGCCYYYVFKHSILLVCFIATGLFLINIDYKILYNCYFYNFVTKIFILYPAVYNKSNIYQKQKIIRVIKRFWICPKFPKIYLIQQRIRQC